MKIIHPKIVQTVALFVATILCLHSSIVFAEAEKKSADTDFPYVIQPQLGDAEFAPGDGITIISIRGNREHLEKGGRYILTGSYTLASADKATLAWYATAPVTDGESGETPFNAAEETLVTSGSGTFHLEKTLINNGWLHLTFYVKSNSHGGIYFGEKGFEKTVLKKKIWSDFSKNISTDQIRNMLSGSDNKLTNHAIIAYLGDPVSPPADLDTIYSSKNLMAAFTSLMEKQGVTIKKLAVDDSEFPFLLYGVLGGKYDFRNLNLMKGYSYGGAICGNNGKGDTQFSLNMIPTDQYPRGQAGACYRRLTIRLQMLHDCNF